MKLHLSLFTLALLFGHLQLSAQNEYFQQRVDYRIDVRLNDETHELSGTEQVTYTNNSPDTLNFIIFHLWANAFGDRNSAFARQQLRMGRSNFYYSAEEDMGGYKEITFYQSGKPLTDSRQELSVSPWEGQPDIAKVALSHPLLPGEQVILEIEFALKIPKTISRFGHAGQSYQMSQWYPKPAVYDREGWHPMPYLDMGEFYSEFGSFDVSISLPANYVVAATGALQNKEEMEWLGQKVQETRALLDSTQINATEDPFPPSSGTYKTLRYLASDVHDFAWFADKRYLVDSSRAVLPSGKTIPTWAFFRKTHLKPWDQGAFFVSRAVEYYSQRVGEYPWPQATAVSGPMGAGGGMEYPMVTIISSWGDAKGLDGVITHEVGHNWFYGIFGTNERQYTWMDEGCNSYYDHSYTKEYYPKSGGQLDILLDKEDSLSNTAEILYRFQRRRNYLQNPATNADTLSTINYLLEGYEFPAFLLRYLENYLGRETYDRAMHDYFDEWHFRHPYPQDMQASLERSTGKKLDWLFNGFLNGTPVMDYSIRRVEKIPTDPATAPPNVTTYRLIIENRGDIASPYPVSLFWQDSITTTLWRDGRLGYDTVLCLIPPDIPTPELAVIDPLHLTPELYRNDNQIRFEGFPKRGRRLHPRLLTGTDFEQHRDLYYLPLLAWNNYDKAMPGLGLHNYALEEKKVEFGFIGLYSFVTKQLNGTASLQFNQHPKADKTLRAIRYGLNLRRFTYDYNWSYDYYTDYYRLEPYLRLEFKKQLGDRKSSYLQYRIPMILEKYGYFAEGDFVETRYRPKVWHELKYGLSNRALLMPFEGDIALEYHNYDLPSGGEEPDRFSYIRLSANWTQWYEYAPRRKIKLRTFLGYFLHNDARNRGFIAPGAFNLTAQGYPDHDDYKYDELYLGRSDDAGAFARQISIRDGGFKNAFGAPYRGEAGNSNDFMLAFNFEAKLPQPAPAGFPILPYFDLAYVSDARPIASGKTFADQLWWSGGFALKIGNGFGIYLPVASSENITSLYRQDGKSALLSRITVSFDTRLLKPQNLRGIVDKLNF